MLHQSRKVRLFLTLLAAVALLLSTACSDDSNGPIDSDLPFKITIGLTYQPDIQFSPIYVAAEQGYFAEAGLEVTIRHHGASESLFGALQTGAEDVVFAGGDEMLQARSQGVDVVNIATVYQEYPLALLYNGAIDRISSVEDFRGQRIGIPGEYGENWFALLLLLKQAGLTTKDVDVMSIGYTLQAALMGGQVEAVVGFTNNDAVRLSNAGFPVGAFRLTGLVGAGLGVRSEYLTTSTEKLRAMWTAIAKAMAVCLDNPGQALADAAVYVPGLEQSDNAAAALATLQATTPLYGLPDSFGQQDELTWTSMAQFMAEADLLASAVDVNDAYTATIVS